MMTPKPPIAGCALLILAAASAVAQTPQTPATSEAIQGVAEFLAQQRPGQWLGEDLEDKEVYTPEGRTIGEIDDLLIDQNGRVAAVLIEVGGFLGIGAKRIAVPIGALEFDRAQATTSDPANVRIIMRLGRAELERAPAFRPLAQRR